MLYYCFSALFLLFSPFSSMACTLGKQERRTAHGRLFLCVQRIRHTGLGRSVGARSGKQSCHRHSCSVFFPFFIFAPSPGRSDFFSQHFQSFLLQLLIPRLATKQQWGRTRQGPSVSVSSPPDCTNSLAQFLLHTLRPTVAGGAPYGIKSR